MKQLLTATAITLVLAACSNGANKANTADSATTDRKVAAADTVKTPDSSAAMQPTARKMLDTVNTNLSAVPMDSVK
ncbi:hypothetical protein [Deminuibacter soli]|uniref:Uncharacterized protein n=1 Tax=Deminuibacter soli TaxID=2291815 RepID=A0A3E1NM43_9BACT|nr:hypothetical protein [Deminuibacter soli]RFM28888.1 hypothetical protein DXN05_08965 [Deminuibacter soli]